jgi:tRNA pseudouridine55 synthase
MRQRKGRLIDGVLLLNKPTGITSNRALQQAKRLFNAAKAGHTGSLDPLATGVLPVCFGEATKFSQFLLDSDKRYRTCIVLGVSTDSGDVDGQVISRASAVAITEAKIAAVLDRMLGKIKQIPPMYSALKRDGQPLYKLARQGIEVEREAREVIIKQIDILAFCSLDETVEVELDIQCSKGTYIRSIAIDLGEALGCGGHVKMLHRSEVGLFSEAQSVSLEQLHTCFDAANAPAGVDADYAALDTFLLPADACVSELPKVVLSANAAHYFRLGNPVMQSQLYRIASQNAIVRVFCAKTEETSELFLGLGEITDDSRVAPKRIIANPSFKLG